MDDTTPSTPRRTASAVLGAAVALPVLAIVVIGAGAGRPPWGGDGAWTTPLEVLLGLGGLGLLAALVFVLRNLPGGVPSVERRSTRSRWWLLAGAVAVGVLAWLSGVAAREPGSEEVVGADLGLPSGFSGDGVAPLPTSTTAVVAGLVALGLLAVLAMIVLRGQVVDRSAGPGSTAGDQTGPTGTGDRVGRVPAGPPDAVVLAAWAAARQQVVGWLGDGEHDPPGGLLDRVADTPAAAPLHELTELYLPVRYGRAHATARDAETARRALDALRQRITAIGAGR